MFSRLAYVTVRNVFVVSVIWTLGTAEYGVTRIITWF